MDFELRARWFRESVMALAAQSNVPTDVVVAALADVLAMVAGKLDQEGDLHSLSDRLHSFCERVEETYNRVRNKNIL